MFHIALKSSARCMRNCRPQLPTYSKIRFKRPSGRSPQALGIYPSADAFQLEEKRFRGFITYIIPISAFEFFISLSPRSEGLKRFVEEVGLSYLSPFPRGTHGFNNGLQIPMHTYIRIYIDVLAHRSLNCNPPLYISLTRV